MKIKITLDELEIRQAIHEYVEKKTGTAKLGDTVDSMRFTLRNPHASMQTIPYEADVGMRLEVTVQ